MPAGRSPEFRRGGWRFGLEPVGCRGKRRTGSTALFAHVIHLSGEAACDGHAESRFDRVIHVSGNSTFDDHAPAASLLAQQVA